MDTINVLVVDRHPIVREGVRAVLNAEADMRLVGEAADVDGAAEQAAGLRPDLALVDLFLPDSTSGLAAIAEMRKRHPSVHIVVLSAVTSGQEILYALRRGAEGFVTKGAPPAMIVQAVRAVASGQRYVSPEWSSHLIDAMMLATGPTSIDPFEALTAREREVLRLTAEGLTVAAIAAKLFISPHTVGVHKKHLVRKLDVRNQTDLIRYAIQRGLVPLDR